MRMKWGEENERNSLYDIIVDNSIFIQKGLSKSVSLDYDLRNQQPWIYFDCQSDSNLSFRAHNLELGLDEAIFWGMAAQESEEAKFEGFINPLHFFGRKTIRGYMSIPKKFRKIGLIVKNGRVQRVKTWDELMEDAADFLIPLCQYLGMSSGSPDYDSENATPQ